MFKRKYLKRLQDVQARIRTCKAYIAESSPPKPDSLEISINMHRWLNTLSNCMRPSVDQLLPMEYLNAEADTYKYIHQVGEFFINISDYYQEQKKYTEELRQLQIEERLLKEKLNID